MTHPEPMLTYSRSLQAIFLARPDNQPEAAVLVSSPTMMFANISILVFLTRTLMRLKMTTLLLLRAFPSLLLVPWTLHLGSQHQLLVLKAVILVHQGTSPTT
jgi:hypothetical protein